MRSETPLAISITANSVANHTETAVESLEKISSSYEFDAETDTHQIKYDCAGSTVQPSTAVIEVVAALVGKDSTQLDPLYTKIDPDALDTLAHPSNGDAEPGGVRISFTFDGYKITVQTN